VNQPLRRLIVAGGIAWLVLLVALSNTQLVAGPGYRSDPRNVRLVLDRLGSERGSIITADGQIVAFSEPDPDNPRLFRRRYPLGSRYAHVVGYTSYLFSNSGLEAAADGTLRSDRNATLSGVLDALTGKDTRALGIRLTIDGELQAAATAALGDRRGAVVAIDPSSGAVLAMVSGPSFDPNTILGPAAAAAGRQLESNPDLPLLNRALQASYPPGSTFKVVTTAAALDSNVVAARSQVPDVASLQLPGSGTVIANTDDKPCTLGDTVDLATAFARSCNTVFAALGIDLGGKLEDMAEAFGFGMEPPFELPLLASVVTAGTDLDADAAARAQTAIGQHDLQATPLQMALVAAAIANGGRIMEPHLIADIFDANGRVTRSTAPRVWRRPLDAAIAAQITVMMQRVISEGTGTAAAIPGVDVAGKTGTATAGDGTAPDVWFIGFAPAASPLIAIAVIVEDGGELGEDGTGGTVAAPIARAVFDAALRR